MPPATPPPPPNAIGPDTRGELQAILDVHLEALARGDLAGYLYTIDPTRSELVACLRERFGRTSAANELAPLRIVTLEPYRNTYVRLVVRERDGPVTVYLRRAGVTYNIAKPPFQIWRESWRWYVSEPAPGEAALEPRASLDGSLAPLDLCLQRVAST